MSIYTGVLERAAASTTFASAGLFAALSAARRKRFFHPEGVASEGTVEFEPTSFDLPFSGTSRALVRLSRGAGFPGSLPDVFGLAIKLPELGHDFLLATSGTGRISRHMLLPAVGVFSLPYSSVLPYQLGERLIVFGARAGEDLRGVNPSGVEDIRESVATGRFRFELVVVGVGSESWTTFGRLVVDRLHEGDVTFNPWNCRPPLRPAGPLNRLRLETYQASQAARPDTVSS
ncbi:MAG TPA: hypothetical protein VG408_00990 [Actinomycetota bacterium]|nr:hypothetical protein [Actinomycetota bacterium]